MKTTVLILFSALCSLNTSAQFVAKVQMQEDIPGICDKDEVYALFSGFDGQVKAETAISKDSILKRLRAEVTFLKDKPKYKAKSLMIGLFINCKGEMVKCEMDTKSKDAELNKQIEAVFKTLGSWKAGTLNDKAVDSHVLYSFTIKKGVIDFKY